MTAAQSGHVAILVQMPLSARDVERYSIPLLVTQGIRVTVIDVADIVMPMLAHDRSHYPSHVGFELRVCRSRDELTDAIPVMREANVIFNLALSGEITPENLAVTRAVTAAKRPYLMMASNAFPGWERGGGPDAMRRWREIRPIRSAIARVPLGLLGVRPPDYVVYGGRRCAGGRVVGPQSTIIWAHALDYDNFLAVRAEGPFAASTAVFLDEFRPHHPDIAAMGYTTFVDPEGYYAQLRALFDRIERELELEVVIAASPRSDYDSRPDLFGGRRRHKNRTVHLVAASRLVLAHRSTAIGYAIMARKPVLQIATRDNYEHPSQKPYFDGFAETLGKPIQFYEEPAKVDLSVAFDLDGTRYDRYFEDYVKCKGTPDVPYWLIVLDELRRRGVLPPETTSSATQPRARAVG